MSTILIEAINICKIYDQDLFLKRGENFYALDTVDFVLREGDFISVMGPSGSGKSTLLNCISTLDVISKGNLTILGNPVSVMNDQELSTFRYEYLGFVFQNHNLISTLSIYDNIATPIMLGGKSIEEINEKIQEVTKRLNIQNILHKKPSQCSGGERQRVAIARALVNDPKIIVCDEPTGNLDSTNSHEVLSILSDLNKQGISIIVVTHDAMIASYAKTLMYLRDAKVHTVLYRHDSNQVDFYNQIVKVSTQDTLLKLFGSQKWDEEILTANPNTTKLQTNNSENEVVETQKKIIHTDKKQDRLQVRAILEAESEKVTKGNRNRPIVFTDKGVKYTPIMQSEICIPYEMMENIELFLRPMLKVSYPFPEYICYVMLDINTKNGDNYQFLLMNTNDLTPLFTFILEQGVEISDCIGIQEVYKKYTDHLLRTRYFQRNLKRLKKEFGLDDSGVPTL